MPKLGSVTSLPSASVTNLLGLVVENSKRKWDGFEGKTMVGMSQQMKQTS